MAQVDRSVPCPANKRLSIYVVVVFREEAAIKAVLLDWTESLEARGRCGANRHMKDCLLSSVYNIPVAGRCG